MKKLRYKLYIYKLLFLSVKHDIAEFRKEVESLKDLIFHYFSIVMLKVIFLILVFSKSFLKKDNYKKEFYGDNQKLNVLIDFMIKITYNEKAEV